jgi:hypothetical protein
MCGKKKVTMTFDATKVKCEKCIRQTVWLPHEVKAACAQPLFLCGGCDDGQLVFSAKTHIDYELSCTNCDHKERRTW